MNEMTDKERLLNNLYSADAFLRSFINSDRYNLDDFDIEALHDIFNIYNEAARILDKAFIPLCKVGDTVYFIEDERVRCGEVLRIEQYKESEAFKENAPIQEVHYVNSAAKEYIEREALI